jgi:UDP-glucose 4-epimerase
MSKKVLIIGSCGYTGSVLFEYLQKNTSYELYTIDVSWFGNFINSRNHTHIYYYNLTRDCLSQFDTAILLAAHSSVQMVDSDFYGSFHNNVTNFAHLMTLLNSDQQFIFASSASLYSGLYGDYLTEDRSEYIALNRYDGQKKMIEIMAATSDLQWYGLRMGTLAGISPNLRVDTIFGSCMKAYKETGSINIFNGAARRGVLSTSDFCRGIHSIIKNGSYDKRGLYNLASFNMSINQIGQKFSDVLSCPVNYSTNTSKYYDFTLNCTKMGINFDFAAESKVEDVIDELNDNWDKMNKGVRDRVPDRSKITEKYV